MYTELVSFSWCSTPGYTSCSVHEDRQCEYTCEKGNTITSGLNNLAGLPAGATTIHLSTSCTCTSCHVLIIGLEAPPEVRSLYIYIYEIIINETLKWPSLLPILMQESSWWWQCGDRYIICLFPHLHTPFLHFSPFLISLVVSVDVKHQVYLPAPHHLLPLLPVPNKPCGFCGRYAPCLLTYHLHTPFPLSLTNLVVSVDIKHVTCWLLIYHLHTPSPSFSPSLISLVVSLDVKHHVY